MSKNADIWAQMMSGEIYDATHPDLVTRLEATREAIFRFNNLNPSNKEEQVTILDTLLGSHGENFQINQPFRCDFGANIHLGEFFFANFNLTILDEAEVRFGHHCFIGPNVSIYTACHPLEAEPRSKGFEWAEPVTIGDHVWIGGSVTIVPGVTIGSNVVIGAGSTVTRNVPDNVVVAGNPARIIKHLK
ncbi:MAG: sugar O-acetyltransferase [Muribaculaceae bacterium]|nr:sugar O-acetyltransferase [Muribaculaceae bacterium]